MQFLSGLPHGFQHETTIFLRVCFIYLFLLYTVGFIGLIGYLFWFTWLIVRFRSATKASHSDPFLHGLNKLGILLMVVFLVDEIKIEFLRMALNDYWHYMFCLFAIFLAFADIVRAGAVRESAPAKDLVNETTARRWAW